MLELLLFVVVLGVVFHFVELIPMAAPFHTLVRVIVVICAIVLLLRAFGVVDFATPRLR